MLKMLVVVVVVFVPDFPHIKFVLYFLTSFLCGTCIRLSIVLSVCVIVSLHEYCIGSSSPLVALPSEWATAHQPAAAGGCPCWPSSWENRDETSTVPTTDRVGGDGKMSTCSYGEIRLSTRTVATAASKTLLHSCLSSPASLLKRAHTATQLLDQEEQCTSAAVCLLLNLLTNEMRGNGRCDHQPSSHCSSLDGSIRMTLANIEERRRNALVLSTARLKVC